MQRRIWVVARWLRTTNIKNLLRKWSSGNPKCVKRFKFNAAKYISHKSMEQNLSLEASSATLAQKNLSRFMEPEDILTCSHKTATWHNPESLLITLIPFAFSYYIYLFHFNIIFQSIWRPVTYFLKFSDHTLYNTFLAHLALADLITIIYYMVKSRNFEAPPYEFFSSLLFLPLSGSKLAHKQFVAQYAHFVSFLFGDKSSSFSQTERDKMILSRFDPFYQLKYLTEQSDVWFTYVNEPTNSTSVVHYY